MTENNGDASTRYATFGAGCFWKPEMQFRELDGVVDTAVGYEGGHVDNPTYEQVCTGTTGHAEVVRVTYDPGKVSYDELLDHFWDMHDQTQVNRQGPDVGDRGGGLRAREPHDAGLEAAAHGELQRRAAVGAGGRQLGETLVALGLADMVDELQQVHLRTPIGAGSWLLESVQDGWTPLSSSVGTRSQGDQT